MSYIVRNCPAYSCNGVCCADYDLYCKDYNNCLLKRIAELCKEQQPKHYEKDRLKFYSPSKANFAKQLLLILDIEEVND